MKTFFFPLAAGAALASAAALLASCGANVFDPLDSPTSDAQLTSAARACLDEGDYECARKNYEKLSNDANDVKLSELAFVALDQNGAGMKAFTSAFGKGAGISALNKLVASLAPGAGKAKRLAMYNDAFLKWQGIQNADLRALVKFVTSITLAAEVLAEGAGGNSLAATELVTDPAACKDTSDTSCSTSDACAAPSGNSFVFASTADILATAPDGDAPDLGYFNSAATYANAALGELNVAGSKFKTAGQNITEILNRFSGTTASAGAQACYRRILLTQGIGE